MEGTDATECGGCDRDERRRATARGHPLGFIEHEMLNA